MKGGGGAWKSILVDISVKLMSCQTFFFITFTFYIIDSKKKQNEIRLRKKIDDKKAMKKNKAMVQPTYRVDPEIKDIDDEQVEKT